VHQCPLVTRVLLVSLVLCPLHQTPLNQTPLNQTIPASGAAEAQPAVAAWDCRPSDRLL
jgi:hypothetical protein